MASVSKRAWTYKGQQKEAWIVRYLAGGKHRQKTFERKKDAEKFRQGVTAETANGYTPAGGRTPTIKQCCEEFIVARQRMVADGNLSRSTLYREDWNARRYIWELAGATRVADFTTADADLFLQDLRRRKHKWAGRALSPSTVKQTARLLAAVLDYAKRRGTVPRNVMREVLSWSEHRGSRKVRIRTFSEDDIKRLLDAIEDRRKWQAHRSVLQAKVMIYLAAFCGLRWGEITGLLISNIDFQRHVICVRHSMDRWNTLKAPKTRAGIRDVPMPRGVEAVLTEFITASPANARGLLLATASGRAIGKDAFHRDRWRPALDVAGLGPDADGRRFHFHALRHFFASMMVKSRLSLTDTAELMGHASFDMTLSTYAHPVVEAEWRHTALEEMSVKMLPAVGKGASVAHDAAKH